MAHFGENVKGGLDMDTPLCPLCSAHPDTEEKRFSCEKMGKLVDIKGDYTEIFVLAFSPEFPNIV